MGIQQAQRLAANKFMKFPKYVLRLNIANSCHLYTIDEFKFLMECGVIDRLKQS